MLWCTLYSQDLSPQNKFRVEDRKIGRLVAVYPSYSAEPDADMIRLFFGSTGNREELYFDTNPGGFGILRDGFSANNTHYDAILPFVITNVQSPCVYLDHTFPVKRQASSSNGIPPSKKELSSES